MPEITLTFPIITYLIAEYTLEEHIQIKITIPEIESDSSKEIRIGCTDICPVGQFIHATITIQILITNSANSFSGLFGMVIHFFLCLENSISHKTIKHIGRPTDHEITNAISRIFINHVFRKFRQFCLVSTYICRNSILEFGAWVTSKANFKFKTSIVHTCTIDPRFSPLSHYGDIRSLHKNILCFLEIVA